MWFKNDARNAVSRALGLFEKIIKQLRNSIELCYTEIEERSVGIDTAITEKKRLLVLYQKLKKL